MSLDPITTAPQTSDFTPLSEYSSQTPGSFFGATPVLHYHSPNSLLKIPREQFNAQPDFQTLAESSSYPTTGAEEYVQIEGVDVWVTSRHVLLFSTGKGAGLRIEYPTITVTAQDGRDVLLELNLSDQDTADEDIQFVQMRIVAGAVEGASAGQTEGGAATNGTSGQEGAAASSTALFKAISDCQELNPDPPQLGDGDDEEGGIGGDPTAPGATGWITSENMGDYMDENGEFRMPEGVTVISGEEEEAPLGEGAGRRRGAEEIDRDDDAVDGADGDGKWQRTG